MTTRSTCLEYPKTEERIDLPENLPQDDRMGVYRVTTHSESTPTTKKLSQRCRLVLAGCLRLLRISLTGLRGTPSRSRHLSQGVEVDSDALESRKK